MDIQQFLKDRHDALLSMDRATINAYCYKYGVCLPSDEQVFWIAIHKARTACLSLPKEARSESKAWLEARGYRSWD